MVEGISGYCRTDRLKLRKRNEIYVEIPINKELLAGYDPRFGTCAGRPKFTPSALMVGGGYQCYV